MKKRLWTVCVLCFALMLTACEGKTEEIPTEEVENEVEVEAEEESSQKTNTKEYFSNRDYEIEYDTAASVYIELQGDRAKCDSAQVEMDGNKIFIVEEGIYILSGELEDGMVIVDVEKTEKVQLVLDGASICSETSAAIYVQQADKVFVTTAAGTENMLANGGVFENIDDNQIDAVLYSKEDLTLNGEGSLVITSPAAHGVVSKDELTVTSGTYEITSASHGMVGKDCICIADGSFSIVSGKDGMQAEHEEDAACGYIYIGGGIYDITAEGDGLSASGMFQIDGGTFDIISGGGSENAKEKTSDSWGGFGGGGMGDGPGHDMGGGRRSDGSAVYASEEESEEDSTSIKGIKSSGILTINGGTFTIDAADDGVHANSSMSVHGGNFTVKTGDDGFHADEALLVTGGTICISESYEGMEGLSVEIQGGTLEVVSTDDGMNAAGGSDGSGFGGHRGNDMFSESASESDSFIKISGGTVSIKASGDGIDSNGTLLISGGHVTVCGPTMGDTAVLDYDLTGEITGGTFIGTGAVQMAQTFSASENQGVFAVSVGSQESGTEIVLKDMEGNTVISYAPEMAYSVVILSSPEIQKGETYLIEVGESSGEFEAS